MLKDEIRFNAQKREKSSWQVKIYKQKEKRMKKKKKWWMHNVKVGPRFVEVHDLSENKHFGQWWGR